MIILDVEQGGMDWKEARLGIPTTSRFSDIMQPKGRKYSGSARRYISELLAEWALGVPMDGHQSWQMERGIELEPDAIRAYEFRFDVDTVRPGFVLRDDKRVGASPDIMVPPKGGAEIKCRLPPQHIAAVLGDDPACPTQVQGCMWICEAEWWDQWGYCPGLPNAYVRTHRDDKYIADLSKCMDRFLSELDGTRQKLITLGARGNLPHDDHDEFLRLLQMSVDGAPSQLELVK